MLFNCSPIHQVVFPEYLDCSPQDHVRPVTELPVEMSRGTLQEQGNWIQWARPIGLVKHSSDMNNGLLDGQSISAKYLTVAVAIQVGPSGLCLRTKKT